MIETERCRMRPHRIEDFTDCAAMWADPVVTRYIGGKPLTGEETWTRLLRYIGHWAALGFGYWAVEEKTTGRYIGEAGFADYKRDISPRLDGMPEIGWIFATRAHGKGYATETVKAAVAWGDSHFGQTQTACLIDPENLASIHVAEKCGYQQWRRTMFKNHPVILFTRDQPALK